MEFLTIKNELEYNALRYRLKKELEDLFVLSGYTQIEPPIFEEYDSYTAVNSGINKKQLVKLIGGNGKVLILRPDTTINVLRSLIPRWQVGSKLKLFYNSTIYRNRRDMSIKERKQLGIEYLGEESLSADREVIELALTLLQKYNQGFLLELGSSKYIGGLLNEITDQEQVTTLKQLLARKNEPELTRYFASIELEPATSKALKALLSLQGDVQTVLVDAKEHCLNEEMRSALKELESLTTTFAQNSSTDNIHLDLSMITELDYYDGVTFKGYFPNSNYDILSGGRYDSLTALFGKSVPAIGFSINLDKLLWSLIEGGDANWNI